MNPRRCLTFGAFLLASLAGMSPSFGSDPLTPVRILEKADKVALAQSSHMVIEQSIKTTSGDIRTFVIESWSKDAGDKNLMRFISPAPSAGIGMLSLEHGENIWAYFPESDDLRKIASSARNGSMEGSDFSYEDMAGGEYARQYEATGSAEVDWEGKPCYKLELLPKKGSQYKRIEVLLDREKFISYETDYFDKKDRHIKTLTFSDWKQIQGIWTPYAMVMKNLKKGSTTTITVKKVAFNVEIEDSKFTTEFLTLI